MRFSKIQACGNDYVCVELFTQNIPDPAEFAKRVSPRHTGIGSDGVILVCPSQTADFKMRIFNIDGSEGEMCGNGLRIASKFFYDLGLACGDKLTVETLSGIKDVSLTLINGKVADVSAQIGKANFDVSVIPCTLSDSNRQCIMSKLNICDSYLDICAVSMGNPHCCIPCDEPEDIDLEKIGPVIENHPVFPKRTNVEFFKVIDKNNIYIRTWERGCGETLGCATGSAACVATAIKLGIVAKNVKVMQRGGHINVAVDKDGNYHIQGEPITVFDGIINYPHK